jgi:uncharacterized ion transporter superfamily protein YfcC
MIQVSSINKIFQIAATYQKIDYTDTISLFFFSTFVGLCFGYFYSPSKKIKELERKLLESTKEADHIIQKEYERMEKKLSKLKLFSAILLIFIVLFTIFQIWLATESSRKLTAFNQHLNVLSPYITEMKRKELISKWSLMKNKKDYDEIYREIYEIAKNNNIILPKIPSF